MFGTALHQQSCVFAPHSNSVPQILHAIFSFSDILVTKMLQKEKFPQMSAEKKGAELAEKIYFLSF